MLGFRKKKTKKPLIKWEEKYDEFLHEECGSGCSLCSSCQDKIRRLIRNADKANKN